MIRESIEIRRKNNDTDDGLQVVLIDERGITLSNGARVFGYEPNDPMVEQPPSATSQNAMAMTVRVDDTGFNHYIAVVPKYTWFIESVGLILESQGGLDGTLQIKACQSSQSIDLGTDQLVSPLALNVETDVVHQGNLLEPTSKVPTGGKFAIKYSGIVTGLRGLLTIVFQKE